MALGNHTFDNGRVWRGLIDRPFVQVVARHEECRFESVRLQNIQQSRGIQIWSIVVGECHYPVLGAVVNVVVIRNFAQQRARVIQRCRARRGMARVTCTEGPLAIRIAAILFSRTTVSLKSVSIMKI